MDNFSLFAEHAVKKAPTRFSLLYKLLAIAVEVMLLTAIWLAFVGSLSIYLGIVSALLFVLFTFLCRRHIFVTVEYEYRITDGELFFAEVLSNRRRKERGSLTISKLEMIVPYREPYLTSLERMTFSKIHDYASSPEAPDLYVAVTSDEEEPSEKTLYYFEPSPKMLRLLSVYNRRTVIVGTSHNE